MEFTFKSIDEFEIIDEALAKRCNMLLSQLIGHEVAVTVDEFQEVKRRTDSELLLFALDANGQIAGLVQLSYHCTPPKYSGYLNSVIIDEAYRGHGLGTFLIAELEKRALARWPLIKSFGLTSSPKKGTQGFYLRLGYAMRTKEAGDETIFYIKKLK